MHPTLVLLIVGLTPRHLGPDTPRLSALARAGAMRPLSTVTPAVTCSVQATFMTGGQPRDHGIVGNGWLFRDLWRSGCGVSRIAGRRRADLGGREAARSRLHLRQAVLVVQHGGDARFRRDAAADLQGRRPQAARLLRAAVGAARGTDAGARPLSAVLISGGLRPRLHPRAGSPTQPARTAHACADAHAHLSAAPRL